MSIVVTCHHMTTRRVNSHSAKDLNVCYLISPKADIKAEDQVQKYENHPCILRHTHRDNYIGFGLYFGHFSKINCIKRNIVYSGLNFLSSLLQEHHQSPGTWKTTHLFTVCCLFTRSSVCYFQTMFLTPARQWDIWWCYLHVSVCLFTCLYWHNILRDCKQDQRRWEKPLWSMKALLD